MTPESPRDTRLKIETTAKVLLWFVYVWVVIDLILLFLAFILLLFGANPQAGFAQWVYRSVERAMAPFRGLFEPIKISDKSVLDTSLLFAMIIYGLVALFIKAAIDWLTDHMASRRSLLERQARAAQHAGAASSTPPGTPPPAPPTREPVPPPVQPQP